MVLNLLYSVFKQVSGVSSLVAVQFDMQFQSIVIGVAVLWLITKCFEKRSGLIRFLLSLVTVVIVAGLGTLSYYTKFSNELILVLFLFALLTLSMLIATAVTQKLCRGKYRPVYFLLWLIPWILITSMLAMLGLLILGSLIMPSGPALSQAIVLVLLTGSIFGLVLYVINLPFLILGFAHPFFRERFCACLHLSPKTSTVKSEADSDHIHKKQSPI